MKIDTTLLHSFSNLLSDFGGFGVQDRKYRKLKTDNPIVFNIRSVGLKSIKVSGIFSIEKNKKNDLKNPNLQRNGFIKFLSLEYCFFTCEQYITISKDPVNESNVYIENKSLRKI